MKSLVTTDWAKYRNKSWYCGNRMPNGVNVLSGLKSWSEAFTCTQLLPPREKSPILTADFVSSDKRKTSSAWSASWFHWCNRVKIASVCGIFFWACTSGPCADDSPDHASCSESFRRSATPRRDDLSG